MEFIPTAGNVNVIDVYISVNALLFPSPFAFSFRTFFLLFPSELFVFVQWRLEIQTSNEG